MKKLCLLLAIFCLTVCGNTQKLVCTSSDDSGEIKTNSTLEIKVNEDRVSDMKFTVDMIFPDQYKSSLNTIADSIKQSKPKGYTVTAGTTITITIYKEEDETLECNPLEGECE